MAAFRYLFYSWGGQFLDALPVQGATPTWEVSAPGTFTGTIPTLDTGLSQPRVRAATWPLRTKLFVERDGALAWGGRLVEPRVWDSSARAVTINAEETTGYLGDRYVPTLSLLGQDQIAIAQQVVAAVQAVPNGNANLNVVPVNGMSGVLRDGVYSQWDFTYALQALTDLTEMESGFEFATSVSWSGGVPLEVLQLAYPYLGRRGAASPLVIEYNELTGGNCLSYSWPDGPGLLTRVWSSATTPDGVLLVASRDNPDLIDAGYPLLEGKFDFTSSKPTTQATLQAYANRQAGWADGERTAAQFTVQASSSFHAGIFTIGDDVRVRITDDDYPPGPNGEPGFDGYMRMGQAQLATDQNGLETYQVTMLDYTEPV